MLPHDLVMGGDRERKTMEHSSRAVRAWLTLLLVGSIAATAAVPPDREALLREWVSAVDLHVAGSLGRAAIEIASWPEARLNLVVADISELSRFLVRAHARLRRSGQRSTFTYGRRTLPMAEVQQLLGLTDDEARWGDAGRLATRGSLLHTDIATILDKLDPLERPAAPPDAATGILVVDGRQQGFVDRGPHWGVARSLLDLVAAESTRAGLRRDWYVAAAAYMQNRGSMGDLVPHLEKARRLFPADPDILFHDAAMHETLAAPFIQQAVADLPMPAGLEPVVTRDRTHLLNARQSFSRALEIQPDHTEARVRLGHVLGALGRHKEAAAELRRALEGRPDPLMEYYAALFLGQQEATLGRPVEARTAFARAAELYPHAQSPRLGLSSVARAAGDRVEAVRILLEALAVEHADAPPDPWWTYFAPRRDESDRQLDAWRRRVARQDVR